MKSIGSFPFISLLTFCALAVGVNAGAQAASSEASAPATQTIVDHLAGHSFLALPSEDQKNLEDQYDDHPTYRKLVFGPNGSVAITFPADQAAKVTDDQAFQTDYAPDTLATWSVMNPYACGTAKKDLCSSMHVVGTDGGIDRFDIRIDAKTGDLEVFGWHTASYLYLVK